MQWTPTNRAQRITFGEVAPGLRLGCLALEHCCDPAGRLLPWAAQVLALFCLPVGGDSAVLRIPILYRFSDLAEVPSNGPAGDGYYWPQGAGGAAIELQLRGSGAPPDPVTVEQLITLIQRLGPAFANGSSTISGLEPCSAALVDALLLERVLEGVARGCSAAGGAPWSPQQRDKQPRSIRRLLRRHGVVGVRAEAPLLQAMYARGVTAANYRRAKGDTRQGLRTADGLPGVVWVS
jgi:hypothetical protein